MGSEVHERPSTPIATQQVLKPVVLLQVAVNVDVAMVVVVTVLVAVPNAKKIRLSGTAEFDVS